LDGLRLAYVYAPELKDRGGPETRQFVVDWFAREKSTTTSKWYFVATTIRMVRTDAEQRTFGRIVLMVTSLDGSRNLNMQVQEFVQRKGYGGGVGG
jgi:hypothetical protein